MVQLIDGSLNQLEYGPTKTQMLETVAAYLSTYIRGIRAQPKAFEVWAP